MIKFKFVVSSLKNSTIKTAAICTSVTLYLHHILHAILTAIRYVCKHKVRL